jgi:small subunit ribosomal protein S16
MIWNTTIASGIWNFGFHIIYGGPTVTMPVKIRLRRMGAKKSPFYRVVVAESRSPRDGRFIETVGTYNPLTNPPSTQVNVEKVRQWLSRGAQPTEAVERILKWNGIVPATELPSETSPEPVAGS